MSFLLAAAAVLCLVVVALLTRSHADALGLAEGTTVWVTPTPGSVPRMVENAG